MTRIFTLLCAALLGSLCQSNSAAEPKRDDVALAEAGSRETASAARTAKEGLVIHMDVGNFS